MIDRYQPTIPLQGNRLYNGLISQIKEYGIQPLPSDVTVVFEDLGHANSGSIGEIKDCTIYNSNFDATVPAVIKIENTMFTTQDFTMEKTVYTKLFQRGATFNDSLNHIAAPFFFGRTNDQFRRFIIMERGISLKKLASFNHNIPYLITYLGNGIQHLHNMSILHRDIKQENLILTVDESNTHRYKIIDFTSAAFTEINGNYHTKSFVVTPNAGLPPELLNNGSWYYQSDLYQFAVAIHNIAHPDYNPSNVFGFNSKLHMCIRNKDSQMQFPPDSPFGFAMQEVLRIATAYKPEHRYSSVAAFVKACEDAFNYDQTLF